MLAVLEKAQWQKKLLLLWDALQKKSQKLLLMFYVKETATQLPTNIYMKEFHPVLQQASLQEGKSFVNSDVLDLATVRLYATSGQFLLKTELQILTPKNVPHVENV